MTRVLGFFFILAFLVSCARVPVTQIIPTTTPALVTFKPTFTVIPPAITPTMAVPTQTSMPEVCDPHGVDYCITEGHFILQRPIKLPDNTSVDGTYRYASTANGTRDPHHGVEFLNKFGTPVYAAADGIVLFAGPDTKPVYSPWTNYYGNVVVIEHANDLYTLYAHLSKILVAANQTVTVGEQIGEVGQTGVAIGSHLHFEVRRGKVENYYSTENPELWLMPNYGENNQPLGAIQMTVLDQQGNLVKRAEYTIQYFAGLNPSTDVIYYGVTYSADMLKGEESAGLGDLRPGKYRIALEYNGQLQERWVEVESGRLTQVVFVVNE